MQQAGAYTFVAVSGIFGAVNTDDMNEYHFCDYTNDAGD